MLLPWFWPVNETIELDVPLSIRGWKQIQFPKGCVFCFLEFRTMNKVQNPSNSECYITN
jgi:hypothetical protein